MKVRPRFLLVVLVIAVAVVTVNRHVCSLYRATGTSMRPTLQEGELCLVWKLGARQPRRGDIVFFRTTDDPPLYFGKRVVALPGEMISIREGQVFIDDEPLDEPHAVRNKTWELEPTRVPDGYYYVIGDHRAASLEDHLQGNISAKNIVGRVVAHWRPF